MALDTVNALIQVTVIVKVNAKVARLFCELRADTFKPLVEYLRERRLGTLENLAKVDKIEVLYKLQGEVAMLSELLQNIDTAEELFAKLRNTEQSRN